MVFLFMDTSCSSLGIFVASHSSSFGSLLIWAAPSELRRNLRASVAPPKEGENSMKHRINVSLLSHSLFILSAAEGSFLLSLSKNSSFSANILHSFRHLS
jgi:hypothetical protein